MSLDSYRLVADSNGGPDQWRALCEQIEQLFGVRLDEPQYIQERGEIVMTYRDQSGSRLDLSSSGRGLQQTLLLLAYLAANPRSVLLLDEPDAHLEILRQRQIYQLLTDTARRQNSQIIAASHSEVILNEAAHRDMVVAFVGKPHRIDDRGSQVGKALKEIGFDEYYQAQQRGWVLYVEGSTDLAILRAFARRLNHPAQQALVSPFVKYVGNLPQRARPFQRLARSLAPAGWLLALRQRCAPPLDSHATIERAQVAPPRNRELSVATRDAAGLCRSSGTGTGGERPFVCVALARSDAGMS